MISRLGRAKAGSKHRCEAGCGCWQVGMVQGAVCNSLLLASTCLRLHLCSSTCDHAPDSSNASVLFKEKSKWEGKQNSLESELRDLHETMASLQSRLRQAELQKMEAQVKCWSREGRLGRTA